jgi:hypothetical protein
MADIEFAGFLYDNAGTAISGATVQLYEFNTTTASGSPDLTDSNGYWSIDASANEPLDVQITSGSSIRRLRYNTAVQYKALEVADFRIRNPGNTYKYDIVPAAISADRTLTLPLITGPDTLASLGLAQTFSAAQTFSGTITVGTVTGNLLPNADDTYDLGSASAAWQDLFLEGDITFSDAAVISTTAENLTLSSAADSNVILGDGTALITVSGLGQATTLNVVAISGDNRTLNNSGSNLFRHVSIGDITATRTGTITATLLQSALHVGQVTHAISSGSGTVNDATGITAVAPTTGSGVTITDSSGLRILDVGSPGGAITNQYGIYIEALTNGGSDYGLYIANAATYAIWVDAGNSRFDGDLIVDGDLDFTGPQSITTSTGNLTLSAASGSHVLIGDSATILFVDGGENAVGIGAAPAYALLHLGGTFTLGSSGEAAFRVDTAVTGGNNHNIRIVDITGSVVTHGSGTHEDIISLQVNQPAITDTGATITNATSLKVPGAPTQGVNNYAFWVDAGSVRLDGSLWVEGTPTEGTSGEQLTSGGAGTVMAWTAASSIRCHKDIIDRELQPRDALERMLDTKVYPFRYKEGFGTGDTETEYWGIMADEAPWAMHYDGGIVNPVNTLGHTVLAIQALQQEIDELRTLVGG